MVMDGISDGSLVYVRRCDCVENGAIAVVAIGEEVTIKHFWKEQDRIILKSGQPGCGRSRLHRTGGTAAAGKRAGPSALLQTLFLTAGL